MKKILTATGLLFFIAAVMIGCVTNSIELRQNCTGYLKRAADANTVETARQELQRGIRYLEANHMTSGYTSILWQTPDEDIAFWYNNLKTSEAELAKVDSTTTALEKTNLLMKLRETLLDSGKNGDELTVPDGLSRYPNNRIWALFMWMAVFAVVWLYAQIQVD